MSSAPPPAEPTLGRLGPMLPVVVALITFVVFLPALRGGFVTWDDDFNFVENPHYRGLALAQLRWMWTTFHHGHYVPLSWMTLGLDYSLWGMDGRGYHLTNVLLHSANAVLVYFLARRVLTLAQPARAKSDPLLLALMSAVAALLFSLHPLRVESVAWITERRDVLSLFFYLGSALAYLRSCDATENDRRWYWTSVALFACALLSKATSVTLPAVLFILNVYPLQRFSVAVTRSWWSESARRIYAELAPFALLAVATVGLTFIALPHHPQLGAAQKLAVSAYSLAFYVWKTIAPLHLAPLYVMPRNVDPRATQFVVSYAAIVALSAGAWLARRRWPGVTAAWVAFVVIVAPLLGFVRNGPQIAADRYTYFASPAVAMLAAAVLWSARDALGDAAAGVAGLVLVVLGTLTWNQCDVWRDSTSLWTQVLRVEPASHIAHNNLGNQLLERRQINDAIQEYRRAIAEFPPYAEAHNNLGVALSRQGKLAEAIAEYQRALAALPTDDKAHENWGIALDAMDRPAESIEHFRAAVAINAENADARVNWGNALIKLGRIDEAIRMFQEALAMRPDNAEAHLNWGVALARQGKLADAIEQFRQALILKPTSPEARAYLDRASVIQRTAK